MRDLFFALEKDFIQIWRVAFDLMTASATTDDLSPSEAQKYSEIKQKVMV